MEGKSKSWTAERRAKQAKWMQENRPWENSTGPKTVSGKAKVSQNAYQHGFRSEDYRALIKLLEMQAEFVKSLNHGKLLE